ncbi:MAG: hypothetical protein M1839_006118 [Geoglossum umbratile]|nr:MAG: hypothetical protein M1839_006118 [Geoglossum umbratile]
MDFGQPQSWLRASASEDVDKGLCARCQRIDFKYIFQNPITTTIPTEGQDQYIALGWLDQISQRESCSFCCLVRKTLCTHYDLAELPPVIKGKRIECSLYNICIGVAGTSIGEDINVPHIFQVEIITFPKFGTSFPRLQLMADGAWEFNTAPFLCHGRTVPKGKADLLLLQRWLSTCEKMHVPHSGEIQNAVKLFPNFRVIDVQRKCVIKAPDDCRYLALSYVWGTGQFLTLTQTNYAMLQKENGLFTLGGRRLSQTVQDAMQLTLGLNERYLWADALCIIQDSTADKCNQINAMDRVYDSAVLTIIAAVGSHADAGLPGVRPDSRATHQIISEVQGLSLSNTLPGRSQTVDETTWNSRAWTYQERLFSSRVLVFTADQVHFQCPHGYCREDFIAENDVENPLHKHYWPHNAYNLDLHGEINFDIYARLVTEYTARSLSYASDGLNAFSAIISALKPIFRCKEFYFGLPATAIDAALLWQPATQPALRTVAPVTSGWQKPLFPSWSWVGWTGQATYGPLLHNLCERTRSVVVWLDGSGKAFNSDLWIANRDSLVGWERHFEDLSDLGMDSSTVYYTDTNSSDTTDIHFSHPILQRTDDISLSPLDPQTGHLHLRTITAEFILTGEHTTKFYPSSTCRTGRHVVCNLAVFDSNKQVAGTVYVDGGFTTSSICGEGELFEFVALSRTTLLSGDSDPAWDKKAKSFVMEKVEDNVGNEDDGKEDSSDDSSDDDDPRSTEEWNGLPPRSTRYKLAYEFDDRYYYYKKPWCLYNVLLIRWQDGVAYRLGVGRIHIDAFNSIAETKSIFLG